jgi:magnesium transporter
MNTKNKISYPKHCAATHMVPNVPLVSPTDTVSDVEMLLEQHASSFATINYIYVVDVEHRLLGVVSIKEIFSKAREVQMGAIAQKNVVTVSPDTAREHVALVSINAGIKAVPVVDASGHFVGVVTGSQIIAILHSKSIEDTLTHAGSVHFDNPRQTILTGSVWLHIRKRLPWLIAGLGGGLVGAVIVRAFEQTLAEQLLVAAFIPTVIYMADAVGSQTEIIFVRAMALDHKFKFGRYFSREFLVNIVLAAILGFGMLLVSALWFGNVLLALVLGLAIFFTTMSSVLVALFVPYLFERLGYDPAVASSPMATILRNILSLAIYFLIVVLVL